MSIQKLIARRFCMPLQNAAVRVASQAPLGSLAPPCPIGSKQGAQLPHFSTTLVAPDPEDAAPTILVLDERMARLCSKKPTTPGCGLLFAARGVTWWRMGSEIGAKRPASGYRRPLQISIVRATASRMSGQRIRQ
jgi:hypothetical protein